MKINKNMLKLIVQEELNELRVSEDPLSRMGNPGALALGSEASELDHQSILDDALCCPDEAGFLKGAYGDDRATAEFALDNIEAAELYMKHREDYLASRSAELGSEPGPGLTTSRMPPMMEGKITRSHLKLLIEEECNVIIKEGGRPGMMPGGHGARVVGDPVAGSGGPGVGQDNARKLTKILAILTKAFPEHASAGE